MSVKIADLLNLPSLKDATVAAGHAGLQQVVSTVSVLESVSPDTLGFDFPNSLNNYGTEIIITAFMECKDNVEQQCRTLERLHRDGDIAIILYYLGSVVPSLSPQLLELADRLQMPLIVMPEKRLELRYGDAIFEIMEAIIDDRRNSTYFATEVIEQISHLEVSQHSIDRVLAMIRDRVQCSVFITDEMGRFLNRGEWPSGRHLPIDEINEILNTREVELSTIECVHVGNDTFYAERELIQNTGADLMVITVKETPGLTVDACKQIKYILKTYINLWTENYGRLDIKQLISAIINNEPEKMRRIAETMHIDAGALHNAYFFYCNDGEHNFQRLQKMRSVISEYISLLRGLFLCDIFDETVTVFSDSSGKGILSVLPELLEKLRDTGIACQVVVDDFSTTTQGVKDTYWLFQKCYPLFPRVFPRKEIITVSDLSILNHVLSHSVKGEAPMIYDSIVDKLSDHNRDSHLLQTLAVYLLDANMSMQETSKQLFVHINTIKYRIASIEHILGHRLTRMPELYDLYAAAILIRLNNKCN